MIQEEMRSANPLLRGLQLSEYMVNTFAEGAKQYWRLWGPLGEPMVRSVEAWAQMQRSYLQFLRSVSGVRSSSSSMFPYDERGDGVVKSRTRETRRAVRESAREAQRIAREAEKRARESEEGS